MRFFCLLSASVFTCLSSALALPADSDYKKVRNKNVTLSSCALISGVSKVTISSDKRTVSLPKRQSTRLPSKFSYFACALNDSGVVALFAKKKPSDTPSEFVFTESDFPESTGPTCQSWPGTHIYKTVGSHHFTDIRRNTIGLILKNGARGPFPSCLEAKDSAGNVVAKLGLYAKGAGWAARYYAGIGCGSGTALNGAAVASRARAKTGNTNITVHFGSTCYGPINATQCIGSQQC